MTRFDLHIHSCLSPCADLEMAPSDIARKAKAAGLDGFALSDHNSARNCRAAAECVRREGGVSALFALEVCTAEEVHTLAVFDALEQAAAMTEWVYAGLPKRVNQPEVFGDQPVVNADDEIEELEWRLLGMAAKYPLPEVGEKAHSLGGLFIACHVDRPVSSVFSQLGVLSGDEGFDAFEISRTADEAQWRAKLPPAAPLLRSSDSHCLGDIGLVWTEADLAAFTTAELRRAFRENSTRPSPRLARF